jgi:hypothetical protein
MGKILQLVMKNREVNMMESVFNVAPWSGPFILTTEENNQDATPAVLINNINFGKKLKNDRPVKVIIK